MEVKTVQSRHSNTKPTKRNKYLKVRVVSVVGALTFLVGFSAFSSIPQNPATHEVALSTVQAMPMVLTEDAQTNINEPLKDLPYEVPSFKAIPNEEGTVTQLVMDVIYSNTLTKENLSLLEQEIYDIAKKKYGNELQLITIHIANSKEVYEKVLKNNYQGTDGFITIVGKYTKESITTKAKHYKKLVISGESKGSVDGFEYDAKDAKIYGDKATIDIVVNGDFQKIDQFIIGFIQIAKGLNSEVKHFALNIYVSEEELAKEKPSYQYDNYLLIYEEVLRDVKKPSKESPSNPQETSPIR